jgi:hypothetical protein
MFCLIPGCYSKITCQQLIQVGYITLLDCMNEMFAHNNVLNVNVITDNNVPSFMSLFMLFINISHICLLSYTRKDKYSSKLDIDLDYHLLY